jgi:hypothetical protein
VPGTRPTALRITDVRSVWGPPLEVALGGEVTVLVGPNRAGTSNVAWALAAALDPAVRFRPGRDRPRRRPEGVSRLELDREDGSRTEVTFAPDGRRAEVRVAPDGRREEVAPDGRREEVAPDGRRDGGAGRALPCRQPTA